MSRKILVAVPATEEQKEYLSKRASECAEPVTFVYKLAKEAGPEDVKDVDAVIGNVPAKVLASAEKLDWLQLNSAGANPYDKPGALKEGVKLTTATGAYGLTVSEHMLALTMMLVRKLDLYGKKQRMHDWSYCGQVTSVEGAVIVVLGMGNIGNDYARKVKALGAHVIGLRKHDKAKPDFYDEQYTIDHLDEVIPRADIIAMVLPGTEDTKNIMDARRLRMMKPGSYLINCGRGTCLDQDALRECLDKHRIAGAALDVTSPEPLPEDSPLWDTERLTITPHVAGKFFLPETLNRVVRIAADNMQAWIAGQPLRNLVKR